ncbi:MAG: trigger factor [Gammaproteobacteria bacterium]|nr:trigger factor [Gammaproteobacteria bacterium]
MQVQVEVKDGLNRQLTISEPAETIDAEVKSKLEKMQKTAKLDGFRPGKIPFSIVKTRFGDSVRREVLHEVIQSTLTKALEQEKLKPAGYPDIDVKVFEEGKPLEYVAIFENYPEIKQINDLTGVKIEQVTSEVTEEDVQDQIANLQKTHAKSERVDRASKDGDEIEIDFEGFVGDKAFEGGKAEHQVIQIGGKRMIPGFEEGLIGKKAGDEFDLKVTFPKEYFNKELEGKKTIFKVKVHEVLESKLPELDDEFAKKLGFKEGLKELHDVVRHRMEDEMEHAVRTKNKAAVLEELLKLNSFDIPKALIEEEIKFLQQQAQERFKSMTGSKDAPEIPRVHFEKQAVQRVALGLLLGEIVKVNDIKADQERVRDIVKEMLKGHENPEQMIEWYLSDKRRLAQFEIVALENQVVEKMLATATVVASSAPYEEVIKALQG